MEFLGPGFGLAQPWLLQELGNAKWIEDLFLLFWLLHISNKSLRLGLGIYPSG